MRFRSRARLGAVKLRRLALDFWRDESGQSTTEYVLLLFFVVAAVNMVGKNLKTQLQSLIERVFQRTTSAVDQME